MPDEFFSDEYFRSFIIGLGISLVLGIFMSMESAKRQPIYGGLPAVFFHYLSSSTMSALIPLIFVGLVNRLYIIQMISLGLLSLAITWVFLLLYAVFESQVDMSQIQQERELD